MTIARLAVARAACGCVREIRSGAGAGEGLGQAEVQDLDHAGRRDLDVRGLQVAVDDPSFVRDLESLGDLSRDRQRLVHGNGDASLAEPRRERLPLDELEHQEAGRVRFLESVDAADVRMIQRGEHPRLALEACQAARVARELARQDFDGDVAPELRVVRAVDFAHPAGAEHASEAGSRRARGPSCHRA